MGSFLADAFDRAVTATIENWKLGIFVCLAVAGVRVLDDSTKFHLASIGIALLIPPAAVYVANRTIDDRTPTRAASVVTFSKVYLVWSAIFFALLIALFMVGGLGVFFATAAVGTGGHVGLSFLPTTVIGGALAFVATLATTGLLSRLLLGQVAAFVEGWGVRGAFGRALELTRGLYWKNLTIILAVVVATTLPGVIALGIAIASFRILGTPWPQAFDESHVRLAATIAIPGRWYGSVAFFVAMLRYYDCLRARYAEVTSGT